MTLRAVVAAGIVAGGAALLEGFGATTILGHLISLALIGLSLMLLSIAATAGVAPCPSCGEALHPSTRGRDPALLCPGCQRFLESDGGLLRETPPDTVAARPVFGAVLRPGATLPERCCVCGEASTRVLAARTLDGKDSLAVPHCDAHQDGASLRRLNEHRIVRARSLAFATALLEQNGLEPWGSNTWRPGSARPPRAASAASRREGRWASFGAALFFGGLAALSHATISDKGLIEIGETRAANLVLIVAYALLGKTLIELLEIGIGALCFLAFLGSFGGPKDSAPTSRVPRVAPSGYSDQRTSVRI